MKVAFATIFDGRDILRGSGTFYYMSREIVRQGHTLHYVGPITFVYPFISRLLGFGHRQLGKRHITFLDPFVARHTGQQITNKLANLDYDLLITNDFAIAGHVVTGKPIILYTDAMITNDYREREMTFSRLSNLSPLGLYLCRQTIRQGLERAALSLFPAVWSAEAALKYYSVPEKIGVLPFGANMEDPGAEVAARRSIARIKDKGRVDLIFVGKDWNHKGGDIAVETTLELCRRGINACLHIVGALPPNPINADCIKTYGLLDKADENDRRMLEQLYHSADIFILPSSNEGFVISALEAAAYGLPALAYDTIGVTTAVKNNESGVLLPLGESEKAYADIVENWLSNPTIYARLVKGARQHYEQTANWQKSVSELMEHAAALVSV